jgi:hypothetical protein
LWSVVVVGDIYHPASVRASFHLAWSSSAVVE